MECLPNAFSRLAVKILSLKGKQTDRKKSICNGSSVFAFLRANIWLIARKYFPYQGACLFT